MLLFVRPEWADLNCHVILLIISNPNLHPLTMNYHYKKVSNWFIPFLKVRIFLKIAIFWPSQVQPNSLTSLKKGGAGKWSLSRSLKLVKSKFTNSKWKYSFIHKFTSPMQVIPAIQLKLLDFSKNSLYDTHLTRPEFSILDLNIKSVSRSGSWK